MTSKKRPKSLAARDIDGAAVIGRVIDNTRRDVERAKRAREQENARLRRDGRKPKAEVKEALSFAIYFAKYIGEELVSSMARDFPGMQSGENPSASSEGVKRVDLNHSTREAGLELMVSFKSVHFGEKDNGNADFTHNKKRNDEELRVEAIKHHLRQPYAVLVAVLFLPFESCIDGKTSSFAKWVEYLWQLKGRVKPDDPPDRFELVFIGLYARDRSDLGFYEVGGETKCPRTGRPRQLLSLAEFTARLKKTHHLRNSLDFHFDGEAPTDE